MTAGVYQIEDFREKKIAALKAQNENKILRLRHLLETSLGWDRESYNRLISSYGFGEVLPEFILDNKTVVFYGINGVHLFSVDYYMDIPLYLTRIY